MGDAGGATKSGGGEDGGSSETAAAVISEETSKRVCTHMNEDHAVSVLAMAMRSAGEASSSSTSSSWKISDATMLKVDESGCLIRCVACSGDLCEMNVVEYKFEPPIASASELRPRLVAVHHRLCSPRVAWLVKKPQALLILVTEAFLAYGTFGRYERATNYSDVLSGVVSLVFGSASNFSLAVRAAFYFSVVAHGGEALYVAYHCRRTLKLQWKATILWFLMICMVGIPITSEFLPLLNVARKKSNEAAAKKAS